MKKFTFIKTLACVAMLLGFTVTSNSQAYIRATPYGQAAATMDVGRGIVSDSDGSYFVTGYFSGTVNFGGANLVSAGGRDIFVAKFSTAGVHQWSVRAGGANDDEGASVAIDKEDSVYVTGYYTGTATTGNFATSTAWGGRDIFAHKLSKTNGASYSLYMAGSTGNDEGTGICFNVYTNTVFATGYHSNNCKFNSGGVIASTGENVFTINLNPLLQNMWVRTGGSAGSDRGQSVCTDDSGRVYITGYYTGNATFSTKTINSYGGSDVFFVKYDGLGNLMAIQRAGSATNDGGNGITCDGVGTIYVTGYHSNNATFGAAVLAATLYDIFITKLDYTLGFIGSSSPGSATNDAGNGIVLDRFCNTLYTTGYASNGIDFGGGIRAINAQGVFLLRTDLALARVWDNIADGTVDEQGNSVACNGSKRIMVTGFTRSTNCSFSGNIAASRGLADIFHAEFQEPGAACAGAGAPGMFDPETNTDIETVVETSDININIYPNPTSSIVNLNTTEIISQIEVFNLAGQLVSVINPNANTATIDLNNYPNSIYILNIVIDGQQYHKKIIKE